MSLLKRIVQLFSWITAIYSIANMEGNPVSVVIGGAALGLALYLQENN